MSRYDVGPCGVITVSLRNAPATTLGLSNWCGNYLRDMSLYLASVLKFEFHKPGLPFQPEPGLRSFRMVPMTCTHCKTWRGNLICTARDAGQVEARREFLGILIVPRQLELRDEPTSFIRPFSLSFCPDESASPLYTGSATFTMSDAPGFTSLMALPNTQSIKKGTHRLVKLKDALDMSLEEGFPREWIS